MGRSILTVLLVTILMISHLSINPTPNACQSLFIIFAARRRCHIATAAARVRGPTDTESTTAALSCSDYSNFTE